MTTSELLLPPKGSQPAQPVKLLRQLARTHAAGPLVVTLYLRLDPDSRARSRYRIAAREAIRRVREALPELAHDQRGALQRDLARVEVQVEQPAGLPHAPGLVLFACESLKLFQLLPLPRVLETRAMVADRPRVAEALAALEGFGQVIVALTDRTHARFFEVTGDAVEELAGLALPATRGGRYHRDSQDGPGWGERDFHNRIREERRRHAAAVSATLEDLVSRRVCDGIVLAGPVRTLADQQRFLARSLADRVLGTISLNPAAATAAEVAHAVRRLRAEADRSREAELMAELRDGLGTGWAVSGVRPVLRALSQGQVKALLLDPEGSAKAYRCGPAGRLVAERSDCQGEGEPVPVPDLLSEAMEEGFSQGAEIQILEDRALATGLDGMAALLRFR